MIARRLDSIVRRLRTAPMFPTSAQLPDTCESTSASSQCIPGRADRLPALRYFATAALVPRCSKSSCAIAWCICADVGAATKRLNNASPQGPCKCDTQRTGSPDNFGLLLRLGYRRCRRWEVSGRACQFDQSRPASRRIAGTCSPGRAAAQVLASQRRFHCAARTFRAVPSAWGRAGLLRSAGRAAPRRGSYGRNIEARRGS